MKPVRTFNVTPWLPPALAALREINYNLRWTWHHDAIELFRWDNDLWEASRNNPVLMLGMEDQDITDQLYGGDNEMRIAQEIMLGIGGWRALEALGIEPAVCHLNEGHSAFLALERARCLMEKHNLNFAEAREAASAGLIFTTHTPVAAGHDYFPPELMQRYFGEYASRIGLPFREFMALGRKDQNNDDETFCMTVLALRMARSSNGNLCFYFNSHRMAREYTERFYLPAAHHYEQLIADEAARAKKLAAWKAKVRENWAQIRIESVDADSVRQLQVGEQVKVRARVYLGRLSPDDVAVELYAGLINGSGDLVQAEVIPMKPVESFGDGKFVFESDLAPRKSGLHGCTVRMLPRHADLSAKFLPGMIVWAGTGIGAAAG